MARSNLVDNKKYHYTYRITNIKEKMYYYGLHSCDCLPKEDIGVKYFSSSKRDGFIDHQKQNLEQYKYKVIKIFSTRKEALEHEIFLHAKFDVKLHEKFYNDSNQRSVNFDTTGKGNYIDENGKTILISREEALTRGLKGESAGRKKSPETIAKVAAANTGSKRTDETKAKMSTWQKGLTLEARWGEEKAKEVKEKYSKAKKGKTFDEIYGENAEAKRKSCGWSKGIPKERVICDKCGKDVTAHTLKRHQRGSKCNDNNLELKE